MDKRIWILAIASFVVGTVELVIAGIIDMIAQDLNVSVGNAGQLITVYSLVFAFGSPILINLTSKVERKKLLTAAMLVFFAGNMIAIVSPNFTILLISRIILAASCSIVVVLSIVMASSIVASELRGRAIGIIFMGISASLVIGVPLGTFIGNIWGWRSTFALVGALTLIVAWAVNRFLPQVAPRPGVPLRDQLRTLKNSKILSAHLISILQMTGQFTIYAYITPFLNETMGLSTSMISLVLFVYGLAGIAGGWIGGWSSDKIGNGKTMIIALLLHSLAILLLPYSTDSIFPLLIVVIVWCAFNMAPSPAIQSYLIQTAPESSDIQLSFNTSSLHIGVAAGSIVGGLILNYYSVTMNTWVGGLIVILAILSAIFSLSKNRTKSSTAHSRRSF
ncbi:DHA1 family purine base/nucleoside efflux pump-like MFS transporter [Paenibacillus cellulosilyticus]|uniref:DHA1 family purine base/nucleoside efflux pump-like MFS transporter n=2 Tax=Paenibacillus cellulosilyticus TaxID=375489 RepID=A0A2V2Z0T8_9BACL|nr:DHA1 family purine base/nucleoside efflux pump-like MFS transporter [Paenibacillus cellulosilyticus]QKS43346.1 MFS transporter [Paenibacillus cellulosilyticus]